MSRTVRHWALVTLVALAIPLTAKADHGRMSKADDLHALFAGATGSGKTSRGSTFVVKFSSDGSATVTAGSDFSDRGKWTIEDDHYCAQWTKIRKGKKACWSVIHENGDDYHLEGADDNDVKIVK